MKLLLHQHAVEEPVVLLCVRVRLSSRHRRRQQPARAWKRTGRTPPICETVHMHTPAVHLCFIYRMCLEDWEVRLKNPVREVKGLIVGVMKMSRWGAFKRFTVIFLQEQSSVLMFHISYAARTYICLDVPLWSAQLLTLGRENKNSTNIKMATNPLWNSRKVHALEFLCFISQRKDQRR